MLATDTGNIQPLTSALNRTYNKFLYLFQEGRSLLWQNSSSLQGEQLQTVDIGFSGWMLSFWSTISFLFFPLLKCKSSSCEILSSGKITFVNLQDWTKCSFQDLQLINIKTKRILVLWETGWCWQKASTRTKDAEGGQQGQAHQGTKIYQESQKQPWGKWNTFPLRNSVLGGQLARFWLSE